MADIIGYPAQVATALATKRATGALVTIANWHDLPDGRVLVCAYIVEPPEPIRAPVQPVHARWWDRLWRRLWSCVAPEPIVDILNPGEVCQIWRHRHWFLHARSAMKSLTGIPLALGVSYLLHAAASHLWWLKILVLLLPVFNSAQIGYQVLQWMSDRIIVTDRRLILTTGVFTRRIQAMPLNRIRGIDYSRTPVGRVFGYGVLHIGYPSYDPDSDAPNARSSEIEFVPYPKKIYHAMRMGVSSRGGV